MEKVIDINEARQNKLNAQKIVEKHLATGKKLTQSEALTILAEMCQMMNHMELVVNQIAMRLQTLEFQAASTSASGVALHRLLQEKKQIFTEEDFKEAWIEYVKKPMEEARKQAQEAAQKKQEKIIEEVKEQTKADSLEAAQGVVEPVVESPSGESTLSVDPAPSNPVQEPEVPVEPASQEDKT
jgi:acyl-homoserine lactone acylase PvdQ